MNKAFLPDTQSASLQYRADIDGLRAIAVLSVVGFHAFPGRIEGGFIGVDIFFVISGYLITSILLRNLEYNRFSLLGFYSRRIKRIFPALIVVLVVSCVAGWFVLLAPEYKQLGKHIAGGAGFISNFVLWNESGYFDKAAESKPLLHLWSLGIEEQFYIVWPVLLWLAWRLRFNFFLLTVFIVAASFILNILHVKSDPVAAFYSPLTRFWELLLGSSLAVVSIIFAGEALQNSDSRASAKLPFNSVFQTVKVQGLIKLDHLSIAGVACIVIGFFSITRESSFPGWYALLPTVGTVLLIAAGEDAWINRTVLSQRILVWIGLISYPLYLWHWSILSFTHIVGIYEIIWIRIGSIVLAIVLSWLTYKLLERPIRFGKHGKRKALLLVLLMVGVGCTGLRVYQQDGIGERFPNIIRELTEFKYDYKKEYRYGSCFLKPGQNRRDFKSCETEINPDKKTLVIWGDSHAAHLYPGYSSVYGNTFNIVQRTASMCPPIIGLAIPKLPHCKAINGEVSLFIKEHKPDTVVLSAFWANYDWQKVAGTISILQGYGIKHIDIVGPVPHWVDTLPKQLYNHFKSDMFKRVPYRMITGLDPNIPLWDSALSEFAEQHRVNYFSPYSLLCNVSGCLTRLGDTAETLVSWDYGHLTSSGSSHLVSKFPRRAD